MQRFRWLIWVAIIVPSVVWITLHFTATQWWIENLIGVPSLLLAYYLMLTLFFVLARLWLYTALCALMCAALILITPPNSRVVTANCSSPVTVLQYNMLYYNPHVNEFINYLLSHPTDLVVLQEVAPEDGEKFKLLDDIYPYQYGGQPEVGYPSSQMILSQAPLVDMSVFHTPDGQNVISGIWRPVSGKRIKLLTAHPPSPRTKELWYRRNALLRTIEAMIEQYPADEMLVIGDFNLSANSRRFSALFPSFETAPVASWPNWNPLFDTPAFTMIGIDHLWLKSRKSGWRICSRRADSSIVGSDHRMVRTKLGY
ncbi:endonuclease/exonuclease/phosphatase family protein [Vibrio sp. SCSIO 43135]|uniref:endonuclease/exonuclease/phosphatase family protein n=1 Tax=Vibrio sp. SCSIO 43135 TaxID=2819096 RepID=UPI00207632AB|nr:endonuclease/exonuclease/phosphatase family protein [Vibrio sp. SCSIO 43135]USD43589.1 endonuclease/exonuclease/phosphatase family protein [Vibrio sp. SCSIO 43135]